MLPHWPSAGLGQSSADLVKGAQAQIQASATVDATTLVVATNLLPDVVAAQGQAAYAQLSGALQGAWNNATSKTANDGRIMAGVVSAGDLVQHGFDPSNSADQQKAIAVVAGGLALIAPPLGTILSGALEILYQFAEAVGGILQDVGLIWFGCRTSGTWTTDMVLNAQGGQLPPMGPGTFASLAMASIGANATKIYNCQGGVTHPQALAAAAMTWNAGASGPPMTVYVPAMSSVADPVIFSVPDQLRMAFQPASDVRQLLGDVGAESTPPAGPFGTSTSPFGEVVNAPFILRLNGSTYTPPSTSGGATPQQQVTSSQYTPAQLTSSVYGSGATPMSTGAKVAAGAAITGGVVLASSAVYAAATHQSFAGLWGAVWRKVKSFGRK